MTPKLRRLSGENVPGSYSATLLAHAEDLAREGMTAIIGTAITFGSTTFSPSHMEAARPEAFIGLAGHVPPPLLSSHSSGDPAERASKIIADGIYCELRATGLDVLYVLREREDAINTLYDMAPFGSGLSVEMEGVRFDAHRGAFDWRITRDIAACDVVAIALDPRPSYRHARVSAVVTPNSVWARQGPTGVLGPLVPDDIAAARQDYIETRRREYEPPIETRAIAPAGRSGVRQIGNVTIYPPDWDRVEYATGGYITHAA